MNDQLNEDSMKKFNMKFDKPTLVTITAPTCSGKTYLLDMMTRQSPYGDNAEWTPLFDRIVGTTTRAARPGEINGEDYWFLTHEQSAQMEIDGEFAELIEFRGNRYGVTKAEMASKMKGDLAPIMILEPQGLAAYERICTENGWEIFKIYVSTPEELRVKRLNERTSIDVRNAVMDIVENGSLRNLMTGLDALTAAEKIIETHTSRLISITGDERRWQSVTRWDAIIPGNDAARAIRDIEIGVRWRNTLNSRLNVAVHASHDPWGADGEHP